MAFNRWADADLDATNPRTRNRAIPAGLLTRKFVLGFISAAVLVFLVASAELNRLTLELAPLALAILLGYSYLKRFTRWSHLVLGLGLGIAPVGGYLAIAGWWSDPWWMLVALAGAVMCWTGGFDILYALQDIDFDRANGLHSLPAKVGAHRSLEIARFLHVGTIALLILVGFAAGQGWLYDAGVGVAAALLVFEHSLVHADDVSKVDKAFFTVNMALSSTFFAFVLAQRIIH